MIPFNAEEMFQLAEQIERDGAEFYRTASRNTAGMDAKRMLAELAEWELDHEKTFRQMRSRLTAADRVPTVPDPNDQAGMYLRAFAEGKVFDIRGNPARQLTGQESLLVILRKAIELEKDSIVFYLGLKQAVPPEMGRDKIQDVLAEEMNHITVLTRLLT